MAGGVRRHVREHHVRRPAQRRLEALRGILGEEVADHQLGAADRLHLDEVDADDAAPAAAALLHHLGPAARRAAQVDRAGAALPTLEAVAELEPLYGRPRRTDACA